MVDHHDGLRARFTLDASNGRWRQTLGEPGAVPIEVEDLDFAGRSEAEQQQAIERLGARLQAAMDLGRGPLLRAACLRRGPGRSALVLLTIHHLAVDGVSWWILLDDLATACRQLRRDVAVRLPAKTASLRQWSRALAEYAGSSRLRGQDAYWLNPGSGAALPVDYPDGDNDQASARSVSVALDAERTEALLRRAPRVYAAQTPELLLAALAQAVLAWSGGRRLRLDVEGHGREGDAVCAGIDLSRTVGWFTSVYPLTLSPGDDPNPGRPDPGRALQAVKQQLRAVPEHGVGFGVLRYLSGDAELRAKLAALPRAELLFNYLGQWDRTAADGGWRLARPLGGAWGAGPRSHLFEINAAVFGARLQIDWVYSENVHRRTTVTQLAERFVTALGVLIEHCLTAQQSGGPTPADFPSADLSQDQLDQLLAEFGEPDQ